MNLSDLNNFTFRKQLKDDGKKNREIFFRERKNIIKTMVNQEVTCYDFQSQIQILKEKNKKLKEKMVIIQTESEALSRKLDDEIRYRPETINKVSNTRKMTDFLKTVVIELNETLSRCRSDNRELSLAIEKCTQEGKAIKEELKKQEQHAKDTITILEEKLQCRTESEKKMLEGFNSQKSFLEGELKEYKEKLLMSENTIVDLNKQNVEFKIQLTHNKHEFEKISEAFKNIKKELEDSKELIDNLNTDIQMKTNMLNDLSKSNEELKSNLKDQEAFTKSILDQNNELSKTLTQVKGEYIVSTEKFKNLEGEHVSLTEKLNNLNGQNYALTEKFNNLNCDNMTLNEKFNQLEGQHFMLTEQFNILKSARDDAIAAIEKLKLTIVQLDEEKEKLNKIVNDKEEIICEKNGEILNLKKECENAAQLVVEMKALQIDVEMKNKLLVDSKEATDGVIEELANKNREHEIERLAHEESHNALVKADEEKTATIESLQAELKRVEDESADRQRALRELECQIDRERAQANHAHSLLAAQNEKLKLDVEEGVKREEKLMAIIKDLKQQRDKLRAQEDQTEQKITGVVKTLAGLKSPRNAPSTIYAPPEPLKVEEERAGIQNANLNKRTSNLPTPFHLQTIPHQEQLFSSQSSGSLFAHDDKYKYFLDESDDQDDYRKPSPPKHRRRLGPKSSVKNLEKELKTTKKRSKKSAVQQTYHF